MSRTPDQIDKDLMFWLTTYAKGIKKAITSKELEEKLDLSGVQIREAVNRLRSRGELVGSISNKKDQTGGYFICMTPEEVHVTLKHLKARTCGIYNAIRGMEDGLVTKFGNQLNFMN